MSEKLSVEIAALIFGIIQENSTELQPFSLASIGYCNQFVILIEHIQDIPDTDFTRAFLRERREDISSLKTKLRIPFALLLKYAFVITRYLQRNAL